MVLCKRCKKAEAVEGKKNCVACAKYMSDYMKKKRAKAKLTEVQKVPKVFNTLIESVEDTLENVNNENVNNENVNNENVNKNQLILNEDPVYTFDKIGEDSSRLIFDFKENKMSPEDFRYFYFKMTGKVFRENKIACVKELIKILKKEIK